MKKRHLPNYNINFVIGSRGSALALWQANHIKFLLEKEFPKCKIVIKIIKTTGDKILDVSLAKIGSKGLFTKEIEDALIDKTIDLAVHSLKDLPTLLPPGLAIAAIPKRDDVRDAFIAREGIGSFDELPLGGKVGTSSLRRQSQLRHLRPDIQITDLRGNVDTRLKKIQEENYDGIILSAAGLIRLGFDNRITEYFSTQKFLPAVGQGALAIEIREEDSYTRELVQILSDKDTELACEAERALLQELGGGCQVPIASTAQIISNKLQLEGLVGSIDGQKIIRCTQIGDITSAKEIGKSLAQELCIKGATELLKMIQL